jgi:hypothetical protein
MAASMATLPPPSTSTALASYHLEGLDNTGDFPAVCRL